MDDNIKEIGYRTIINELYKNINNHIGIILQIIMMWRQHFLCYQRCMTHWSLI